MNSRNLIVNSRKLGTGIQPIGMQTLPDRLRDTRNAEWEKLFGEGSDFYVRVPLSGCAADEYLCSSSQAWGASRQNLATTGTPPQPVLLTINQTVLPSPPREEYWQRWTFPHDFECYGLTIPLVSYTSGEDRAIRMKFGLFEMFPHTNTTQAWRLVDRAKFLIDYEPPSGEYRKLLVPPDPANAGSIRIPAGLYYLAIYPGALLTAKFFSRYPRDYQFDAANLWRADRLYTNSAANWASYNFADVVFDNDGGAPPVLSGMTGPPADDSTSLAYHRIDFGFYGRFIA
ncbi:MAG: hypothetical protein K1X67_07365 [Fimbriimonadaceae bacterium]|nr:hypothetical protein [Fimbriimonadaceae bacterium]